MQRDDASTSASPVPGARLPASRVGRFLLSLVFAGVIYHDAAMILSSSDLGWRLPVDRFSAFYNAMFRVFTDWSPYAVGYVMEVEERPRDDAAARWTWREVDVHPLFPMPRGESYIRIDTMLRRRRGRVGPQLLALYQARRPELATRRVRLYHASWPASPLGYLARYDERQLRLVSEH